MDKNKLLSVMPYILAVLILILVGVIIFTDIDSGDKQNTPTKAAEAVTDAPKNKQEDTAPTTKQDTEKKNEQEPEQTKTPTPTTAPEPTKEEPKPTEPEATPTPTLEPTPTEIADPTMGFKFEDKADYVDTKAGVNLRSACSTTSEKVAFLEDGKRLERTGYNDEWTRVIYDGQECYLATYLVIRAVDSFDAVVTPEPTDENENGEGGTAGTASNTGAGKVVCIDPGHQSHGNSETESLGPGSSVQKAKCSTGTSGVSSGIDEYVLDLAVSMYLKSELESRGYTVVMTRTTNDVNLSNIDRAEIANKANADAYIRVHADSSTNESASGMMTICMSSASPYNSNLYDKSRKLSDCVLEAATDATGAKMRYVYESEDYTGINWSKVPVTIVEMGFMSNKAEDALLADDAYRKKIAVGIANGIDKFFSK